MKEKIDEMAKDEQGFYSSVRGYGLGSIVPLTLMVIVGAVFALFQNSMGVDYAFKVIFSIILGGSGALVSGQFKSAVSIREEYRNKGRLRNQKPEVDTLKPEVDALETEVDTLSAHDDVTQKEGFLESLR